MRPFTTPLTPLTLLLAALLLPGCYSPRFHRAWKEAGCQKAETAAPIAAGGVKASEKNVVPEPIPARWEGRWHSDKRDGGGKLRAVVKAPVDGRSEIFFEAGWHGFTTAYPVSLAAKPKARGFEVSGEHNLKSFPGGGIYRYTGFLSPYTFSVKYQSDYDTGTFRLSPVEDCCSQPAGKH